MAAKFLRAGRQRSAASAAKVNHVFDRVRDWYGRKLDAHACRCGRRFTPSGSVSRSRRHDVPRECRCRVRRNSRRPKIRASSSASSNAPANATIDQTHPVRRRSRAKSSTDFPETKFTFQITFPTYGFGGMVLETVGPARKKPPSSLLPEVQQKLCGHPRHRNVSGHAAGAARRRRFPGRDRDALDRRNRSECSSLRASSR